MFICLKKRRNYFEPHNLCHLISKATFSPIDANSEFKQKRMTSKRITCNSFPWNKVEDFRTPILWPNIDKDRSCTGRKIH